MKCKWHICLYGHEYDSVLKLCPFCKRGKGEEMTTPVKRSYDYDSVAKNAKYGLTADGEPFDEVKGRARMSIQCRSCGTYGREGMVCLMCSTGNMEFFFAEGFDDPYLGSNKRIIDEREKRMECEICEMNDPSSVMRKFDTGATRDSDVGKPDYEGFLSPIALRRYGEYMNKHRKQSDGKMRASDNWQNGIPLETYMKSMLRHVMDLWLTHRRERVDDKKEEWAVSRQEALCAILFNAFGFLHELEK